MESTGTNINTLSSSTGVTLVKSDAPKNPTSENEIPAHKVTEESAPISATQSPPSIVVVKKKRGRPRKYAPDGSVAAPLSPKPISSSAPPPPPSVIDFSAGVAKRGKVRSVAAVAYASKLPQQQPRMETESLSNGINEWVSCSVGASFTPHIITVNAGEDVMMKIISFSQQGSQAICILSANGVISSVTLRQPDSSGGTLTYEGRFEILSLTGSFMPSESGGMRNRSGGMSVSLAGPNGRVVGGGVAGLLVAACPVQIVIGSFAGGSQHDQKIKKHTHEPMTTLIRPTAAIPISSNAGTADGVHHTSSTFHGESWSATPQESRIMPTDINVTLPG